MKIAILLGLSALALTSSRALAQDAESKAAAEALFREATTAFDAGDYATACPKLEGAVALTGGEALGGALLLARCYDKQGKTASAWATYNEVAAKARAAGQTERAATATAGAAALEPKLHYVALQVPDEITALPDARITRQGKPVRRELWANRFPVDPGQVTFEISASGKKPATRTIAIPAGPGVTPVAFEPLADDDASAPAPKPPPPLPRPAAEQAPPPAPARDAGGSSTARIGGAALAGVGFAGMAASVVIGVVAKGNYDDAVGDSANCRKGAGGTQCADTSPAEDARSLGNIGTVAFVVGSAAVVGGGLLFLLSPSGPPDSAAVPRVGIGRDGGSLTWKGTF